MEPTEILNFLQEHSDWLSRATFWRNIGQMLLFGILRMLYRVAVFAEELIDAVLLARTFLEQDAITQIFDGMLVFSVSLTTLTLITIAVRKLINPKIDLKGSIIRGCFTVALIASTPGLIVRGLDVSINAFEHTSVLGSEEHTSISLAIIRENVADMHFVANHALGFAILDETTSMKNTLNEETIWHVDFTEVLTPSDISSGSAMHALRYTTTLDESGELGIQRIRNGWLDVFDEGYFRWTANWGVLYTTMPIITLFLFCTAFILLATLLDLIFMKIIVPILAPTDVETGQKMKHIAKDTGAALLSIALIGVSLSVFRILLGLIFELDINFIARLIYLSVAFTTCMKGSSAFGKYLGVDIGMGNGFKSMLKLGAAGLAATKLSTGGAKLIKGGVVNGVNGAKKIGDGLDKVSDVANNVASATTSKAGQLGAEFVGLGAKDFMRTKASNLKEKLTEELAPDNPFMQAKSTFDEAIANPFKDGQMKGDANAINAKAKLRNQQADKKKQETMDARAKKVKQYDPTAPLPKFGENRERHENNASKNNDKANDKPIDIFNGSEIPLSNNHAISNVNPKEKATLKGLPDEFTLPEFGKTPNVGATMKQNAPEQPADLSSANDFMTLKSGNQATSKVDLPLKKTTATPPLNGLKPNAPKYQSDSSLAQNATLNTLSQATNTPRVNANPTTTNTPKVNVNTPLTNTPRVNATATFTNTPKVTTNAGKPSANIPKQITTNNMKGVNNDEE